jgi:putative Holliday junction resolvase
MRTLAIDLGTRCVGLALSDEGGKYATPFDVLTVSSPQQAITLVTSLISKEGVQQIVLGLPLNMDDTIGGQARDTFKWGQELAAKTASPVIYVDERLSSFEAEQTLINRKRAGEKLTRSRKKEQLDAVAAASFLQQFLDGKLTAISENWIAGQI